MSNIKHNFKLTKEEREIDEAIGRGEYTTVPMLAKEKERLTQIARNTDARNKTITIRISPRNLAHLKAAAAREGIPYQTFVTSLIQKHT